MTKQFSWTITLMATTFLGMPATALPIAPTLDSLKAEASSVLPGISEAYSLTELSGDLPDGAVKVTIGDKGYYFTPKDSDAELLTVLAGTSAGILVEKADGLFEYGGKTYSFDTVSIPSSAFVYLEGSKDDYDFIIIDCPPSLNMLTINSMTTADSVLVPIQCEYYALEGLSQLIHTINLVKERLNPNLRIDGVVFTMYDSRTNLSMQVVENVKQNLNQKVYNTLIPRNIRLAEAPSYGMPINMYDPKSAGAEAYMQLAEEVIKNK